MVIDKKYVVNENKQIDELRKDFRFKGKLDYNQLYEVFSRFNYSSVNNVYSIQEQYQYTGIYLEYIRRP
ncbi:MAG: hypothetical protein LBB45_06360 [Methanobrevibacter sp.]|jgi:hypothetical protein|nr:hypothetical protein [Candidatus Methanovirga basalitermitum]